MRLLCIALIFCFVQLGANEDFERRPFGPLEEPHSMPNAKREHQVAKSKKKQTKTYQLAACLMFQDEAPYLKEWI